MDIFMNLKVTRENKTVEIRVKLNGNFKKIIKEIFVDEKMEKKENSLVTVHFCF